MITQLEAARQLIQRGRRVIPIPLGAKAPALANWTDLRLTEADCEQYFTEPCNLGLILGEPSGWVVDIDLDTDEAMRAAPYFFPPTFTYGRDSRPGSHLLFICKGAKTQKYKFQDTMLLEVRSTGTQSLIPPSQHPSGDLYRNERHNRAAATISPDELYLAAERTAAAALFARYWQGGRHVKSLALSGALLHAGWDGDDAIEFVECVAQAALDDELEDRSRAAQDSVNRFSKGERTTGWPVLSSHFDESVIAQAHRWLNIQDALRLNGVAYSIREKGVNRNAPDEAIAEPWPQPQPLAVGAPSAPYPLDALPGHIGAAVREVVDFVQCPVSLAACSALSVVSLVGQALADVRRADKLVGPCSLYLLAVAESGERKTTCDGYFTSAIEEWERNQAKLAEPEQARHAADMQTWNAKREGILQAIKAAARMGKPTDAKQAELEHLEANKPQAPRVAHLIYADTTPEKLAWNLTHQWPSGGVVSNEAGIVFGGHAMARESGMRNMALLNVLWDGGSLRVDRKTSDSFTLHGARLTMGLAVQPETVRAFFENAKGQARGSGFAARFLIAYPESTQGNRLFKAAPQAWPHLSAFHRRMGTLLDQAPSMNERGALELPRLDLSPQAQGVWIHFHNEVERELKPGGDMAETRDVASKAADNAARMAALFHIYEQGLTGAISAAHMQAAMQIVTWHLYEASRFLGEVALPQALDNAAKLDAWLLQHCRATKSHSVRTRYVRQYGPRSLRKDSALDEAAVELVDAYRVRLVQKGKQIQLEVNPFLLGDGHVAT